MDKKYAKFLTILFCGFLAVVFTANALTPDLDFSQVENRTLSQRPKLKWEDLSPKKLVEDKGAFYTGKFMADYETYVTDQFVQRDAWVAAKAWSERLVGKQENNGVYFCADGTLISRFEDPDWSKVEKNLSYVDKFAEKAGVPVTFGLIPTQAWVWRDKLPAGAPNADQSDVYQRARDTLTSARLMDDGLWTTFRAHGAEPIFYRTDHHWTSQGAWYGYAALMTDLGMADQIIPLEKYTKTTVSTEFYGTVFSTSGVRWVSPDEIDVYVPETDNITVTSITLDNKGDSVEEPRQLYDESYLSKKDKYSMFLGGQQSLGVVKTGNPGPRLVLIRDSYSDSLVPFLTPHFSEIHLVDLRYNKQSTVQYIADNNIDLAVVLYSVPNFVTDTNLVWLSR